MLNLRITDGKRLVRTSATYIFPVTLGFRVFSHNFIKELFCRHVNHYQLYLKDLEIYKLENDRLKKEILSRDAKIRDLETVLAGVKREEEKYENGYYTYMHKIDKIREGLESQVPVNRIIEYIENGDDE